MQLVVQIRLKKPLSLPINYNHILQAVIYRALSIMPDYSQFLHAGGFTRGQRKYKIFQFSQLDGEEYKIREKRITFYSYVSFEVRSPEPLLIRLLADSIWNEGITFGEKTFTDIQMELYDYTVEESELIIRMKSPLTVYSTDLETNRSYYYNPEEPEFYELVNDNFYRKYQAYYGVLPSSAVKMEKVENSSTRKIVTRYKGSYINAWYGTFQLKGKRKYLDFLYQTGVGSKNSQGFGMFEIM